MLKHLLIWTALLISFFLLALRPTWSEVQRRSTVGSDFATYYYAVKVAQGQLDPLDVVKGARLSKSKFLRQLKIHRYKVQKALFMVRDKPSFQTVARIKTPLLKHGIWVGLDSVKPKTKSRRKRSSGADVLFSLMTNDPDVPSFDLYQSGMKIKTIEAEAVEQELVEALSSQSGTFFSASSEVLVRPFGALEESVKIRFESDSVAEITEIASGVSLDRVELPIALPNPDSPYDSRALSMAAQQDLVWKDKNGNDQIDSGEMRAPRTSVHPFLYPPPALLMTAWISAFSLPDAYVAFHFVLWASFFGILLLIRIWLNTPWYALAFFGILFSPVTNSIEMGQINLIVLFAIVYSLYRGSGLALSIAGMIKMSPALLVAPFAIFGIFSYPIFALTGAVALSLLSLPWLGFSDQIEFYRVLLPQFGSGEYLGLKVPIDMPGNHSLPNLCHQIWPGDSRHVLSPVAKKASSSVILLCLLVLSLCAYRHRRAGRRALECICGAFVALMVLTPVYAYEHHLVFMTVPIFILYRHLRSKPSPFAVKLLFLSSSMTLAYPLSWLWKLRRESTQFEWFYQESKSMACLMLMGLCVWAAGRFQSASKAL